MMVMQERWSHSQAASGSKRSDGSFSDSSNSFVRQVKLRAFTRVQQQHQQPRITHLSPLATAVFSLM